MNKPFYEWLDEYSKQPEYMFIKDPEKARERLTKIGLLDSKGNVVEKYRSLIEIQENEEKQNDSIRT